MHSPTTVLADLPACLCLCPTAVLCRDDGVGLAAPQVGVNVRLMVFNETGKRGAKEETVLVNPKIVSTNKQQTHYEEGCLSFPRIFADVEVRFQPLCRSVCCLLALPCNPSLTHAGPLPGAMCQVPELHAFLWCAETNTGQSQGTSSGWQQVLHDAHWLSGSDLPA